MIQYMKDTDTGRIIRDQGKGHLLEYYDFTKKQWIEDFTLSRIFFGGINAKRMTEAEVKTEIGG